MSFRSRGLNKFTGSGWSLGGSPSEYRAPVRNPFSAFSNTGSTGATITPPPQPTSAPSSTPSPFRSSSLGSSVRTPGYFSGPTGQKSGLFGSPSSRFSGLAGRYM